MVAFFVIFTFVAFILADAAVQWAEVRKTGRRGALREVPGPSPALAAAGMPGGVFSGPGHTWVALDPSGRAKVGMDRFARKVLGRIDGVELPVEGRKVLQGEALFAIRQGSRKAVFVSPVDGVVGTVNGDVAANPSALADPYGKGWICALQPASLARNLRRLFIAEEAREWIESEARRFHEFLASRPLKLAVGEVLQDGGQATEGVLESLDDEAWTRFAREFLGGSPREK